MRLLHIYKQFSFYPLFISFTYPLLSFLTLDFKSTKFQALSAVFLNDPENLSPTCEPKRVCNATKKPKMKSGFSTTSNPPLICFRLEPFEHAISTG